MVSIVFGAKERRRRRGESTLYRSGDAQRKGNDVANDNDASPFIFEQEIGDKFFVFERPTELKARARGGARTIVECICR